TLPLNPGGPQDNVADEWARFMKKNALNISTYTVDVNKGTTGQGPGWTALLKSMAAVSSGKYFDVSSTGTQISDALNAIFSEIQSVNSVFASVSLPVSVNTQGTYLNQVYVGMFRPDQDARPRWAGNLKQYKLGNTNGAVKLQDADGTGAINNQTGFIAECARSYWTPTTVDTEWTFRPQGDCLAVANSQVSNFPDGNIVEKGAQAYKLRGASARTVKTCNPAMASCTSLTPFSNSNVTQAMLGASTTAERDALINWAIGQDNNEDEDLDGNTTENRLSMHGDVVHSRPVAINLGTDGAPQVVVFYGANDGMLRAVNANRTAAIGAIPAGGEMWSFMAPEFYTQIKRIRSNTPPISFPTTTVTGAVPKAYGMDGPITSFKGAVGGVNKTFVYASMRRGGRSIYAFDVTNSLTAPTSPTLKWRTGCPNAANDTDCTSGMGGLGQTWSSPKSLTATGYGSGTAPMLILGGGYSTCDDYDALSAGGANHNCTSASKGHYVYVLDADTGAVVKTFDTGGNRGIVADITIVRDSAGQAIYAYTADLGGDVYRIDLAGASTAWTLTKIASLGCASTSTCTANRKFVFAPSVVAVDGNYVVMLGSGDREKPLTYYAASTAVANYFFMFTDKPTVAPATYPGSVDCGSTVICLNSLFGISSTDTTPTASDLSTKKGWYLGLNATEQVVTSALTMFGVVTFSTHQPAVPVTGSCSANLGSSRVYNVGYANAASTSGARRYEDLAGDGLPPSPVGGLVTLDDGSTVPFCIGCSKDSPLEGRKKEGTAMGTQPKNRLYWYIQK
ncbi:MAG: pilus assembly protein PilY, partial [Candidatus Saccharibacteria bacterium]|nr:pilus assembly protein PilY [Rhodoferax sp.]